MHSDTELSDQDLVDLAKQQLPLNATSFQLLITRYYPTLVRFCTRFLHSKSRGEEVVQEVLIKVFHALPKFQGDASFKTWIFRIAHNRCVDEYRRMKNEAQHVSEPDESLSDISSDEHTHENQQESLDDLLYKLPYEDREILMLKYIAGYNLDEIAELKNLSVSAVKMRSKRAIDKLKAEHQTLDKTTSRTP